MTRSGFRFGLEGEYLLADAATYRPLWHPDLTFDRLNALLEAIDYGPLLEGLTLAGLELDPPHRRIMPYYVEGYGLPDAEVTTLVDVLPKGVEIRTPVCPSLESCLGVYERLYEALQKALAAEGWRALPLSHHPLAWEFRGPQNHRRHDWWQWGMRAMVTYGPDLNISLPEDRRAHFDWDRLQRRINYYAPAMVAFALASPVGRGDLYPVRGRPVLSLRTYRRSLFAPAAAFHPKEQCRLEFKAFDMPTDRREFAGQFLLWWWLVLDEQAPGHAEDQDRVYDLGAVARFGWDAEDAVPRAEAMLDRARRLLTSLDVDPAPLEEIRHRLDARRTPAHAMIEQWHAGPSVPDFLRWLDESAEVSRGRAGDHAPRDGAVAPLTPAWPPAPARGFSLPAPQPHRS